MNNNIKKVVFYTTRKIHPLFTDENLTKSETLISYFVGLKDKFSEWLNHLSLNHLSYYKYIDLFIEKLGREEAGQTLLCRKISYKDKKDDVINIEGPLQSVLIDWRKKDPSIMYRKYLPHIIKDNYSNEEIALLQKIYLDIRSVAFGSDEYQKYQDKILDGETTHLSRNLKDSKIKHRLGVYHLEEDEFAVMAIWPWAGDKENDHDSNWPTALYKTAEEFYPNVEQIILLCHDEDFIEYSRDDAIKNQVVDYNPTGNSLVVYQHTNKNVLGPIEEEKEKEKEKKKSPREIWEAIIRYLSSGYELSLADKENQNAQKHNAEEKAVGN